ncbi:hypothetical protein E2C01_085799 [Portunus trituberculatus]|uniref:Uncharacterized protein n=1 Tax=Portunus trituberculatus TaxID=210409 RepID=A0A5B7JCW7_PORTR|nr:hypothetical protein [Portunus trituberculatus]
MCLSTPPLNKRERTQKLGKCSQTSYFPLEQQTRCSIPSRPNQQQTSYLKRGGHNSQTETGEHPEQPSNTCLNPVPEPKSARVYLC